MISALKRRALWVGLGLFFVMVLPFIFTGYKTSIATEILIFAILAMSIDILAGHSGRTPLCHGAIFGVATYVVLYYVTVTGGSVWVGSLLGILAAVLTAVVFALLAIRTSGVYFILLTLALGMIVWGLCLRWTSVTGGENGLRGTVRPEWLANQVHLYYFVAVCFVVLTYAMWRFVNSPFGQTLKGIRESESRMRTLGYDVSIHLFLGFTVSGFFAGIAGALYAFFNSFVSPSTVALAQSVEGLLMAIVGGAGSLIGSIIGSALVIILENAVSLYTERWLMVLGFMFIITMLFAPQGIVGAVKSLMARYGHKPAQKSSQ
jgi:branched-chain amino acid transport system permease protein